MQIINNDKYNFQQMIQEFNNIEDDKKLNYKLVESLATSPATKRGIYQSLKVVEEIVDYIGNDQKILLLKWQEAMRKRLEKIQEKNTLRNYMMDDKDSIENYKKLKHELE